MSEVVLTVEEVAKLLRVSVATVRALVASGELKSFRVGNQIRIKKEDLDAYMSTR